MSSKAPTHIFRHSLQPVPNREAQPMEKTQAYRSGDGMLIASANDCLVGFGEDPQRQTMRVFIDRASALKFLRDLMDRDWAVMNGVDPQKPDFMAEVARGWAANISEEYADKRIVPADQRQVLAFRQ